MEKIYKNPLVSICIPTFNNADYLRDTISSILNQTYKNIEIIILDNASTDGTEQIVNEISKSYDLKYDNNQTNLGAFSNFNKSFKIAKGDYIAIFHSDDIYEKNIIEREMEILLDNENVGAVFTTGKMINGNDKIIGSFAVPRKLRDKTIFDFKEVLTEFLKNGNSFILCPTFMVKKEVIDKCGFYNCINFGTAADIDLWLRILKDYNIAIINEKLVKRRISDNHVTTKYNFLRTSRSDFFSVMNLWIRNSILKKKILRQYKFQKSFDNLRRAYNLLILGDYKRSKKILFRSITKDTLIASFESLDFKKNIKFVLMIIFRVIYFFKLEKFLRLILIKTKYRDYKSL